MKRLTLATILTFGLCAPSALAHDFWLAPQSYQLEAQATTPVSIMIGHPEDRTKWPLNAHRVTALKSLSADGIVDHQASMQTLLPNGALPIKVSGAGTHVLTIETTSAISVLAAEKFNAYLKEEGLTPIADARRASNSEDIEGREIYSRRGKALIHVAGNPSGSQDYVTKPVGLTLEIVPNENPYDLEAAEAFTSTIYYRGAPMQGVTIGLISLDTDAGIVAIKKSDASGHVTFPRPDIGEWMVHAVWSDPLENRPEADFDTIFSSLSFGF